MNKPITIKHRTVRRNGYEWSIEIVQNRAHTPINKTALVCRNGDTWGCVQLFYSGKINVIPLWPAKEFPAEVLADIRSDFGLNNT